MAMGDYVCLSRLLSRRLMLAPLLFFSGKHKHGGSGATAPGGHSASGNKPLDIKGLAKENFCCSLLERIGVGYFCLDGGWNLSNINSRFAAMRECDAGQGWLGAPFLDLLEEKDIAKAEEYFEHLAAGDAVSGIFVKRCSDGKILHHLAIMTPVCEGSRVAGAEGLMIDITDQRAVEERIHRHLTDLAQVQRVNTMGKMVSELAHEIAQPLYAITNYAEACSHVVQSENRLPNEMLLRWMEQITEQANRAGEVVRRLRGYIHKSKSQRVEIDLNQHIENVIRLMGPVVREHNIDVEFHAAEPLPKVWADPIQIDQVAVNLIQNAVEAMANTPKQQRRIIIETSHGGNRTIHAAVRDMGQGVDANDLNRIFDAFYTTKEEGMGIGLAICRSIMLDHGGKLWPTHNLNRGMTFHFSLPKAGG